jgi:myosin heavy subunit
MLSYLLFLGIDFTVGSTSPLIHRHTVDIHISINKQVVAVKYKSETFLLIIFQVFDWMSVHPSNNDYSAAHSLCWAPDEQEVYRLVKIIREDTNGGKYQVAHYSLASLSAAEKTVTISSAGTYPVHNLDELSSPPSDLIQLYEVHPPGILHALRTRFAHNLIYTSIGPILVSINPFKAIPGLYEDSVMQKYADGEMNLADNPHLFAMAHDAHIGLQMGKNQSLVISGESGAGKTEATKHCLNYFASVAGSSLGLQDKVLQASPILEAWGNAKTIRNNNSSRFGKFIEIWFGESYDIQGSLNTTYLLEKSRVVMQDRDERNYHIFYMLLFGASEALKRDLVLDDLAKNPESVTYINQSGCMSIAGT